MLIRLLACIVAFNGLYAANQNAPCKDYPTVNTIACGQLNFIGRVIWEGFVNT